MKDRWRTKIEALLRLSEDRGATEAEKALAKEKLQELIAKHPEAYEQPEYKPRIDKILSGRDFLELKRNGMTDGEWTADTMEDALVKMVEDYKQRLERLRRPKLES